MKLLFESYNCCFETQIAETDRMRYTHLPRNGDDDFTNEEDSKRRYPKPSTGADLPLCHRILWWFTLTLLLLATTAAITGSVLQIEGSSSEPTESWNETQPGPSSASFLEGNGGESVSEDWDGALMREITIRNFDNANQPEEVEHEEEDSSGRSRFFKRGLPLVDPWLPTRWYVNNAQMENLYRHIGHVNADAKCNKHSILSASGTIVITTIQLKGFGSNIMFLVNDIIYSLVTNRKLMIMSRRHQDLKSPPIAQLVAFSNEYENSFSFMVDRDTACGDYESVCHPPVKIALTRDSYLCRSPTQRLPAELRKFLAKNLNFFYAARVELMRMLTRLNPLTRFKVDANIAGVPMQTQSDLGEYSITVHVRRGDKSTETTLTPSEKYVNVTLAAIRKYETIFAYRPQLSILVVVTDDTDAGREVISLFDQATRSLHSNNSIPTRGYYLRDSAVRERPDVTTNQQNHGMVAMLGDLKLMVTASIFIGTQSSNFGLLACYLRGGNQCFSAEITEDPYEWDHSLDKWL